jgi:hypothetical protein
MANPREPDGSKKEPKPKAVFSRLKCPNCGRDPAIVFPLIRQYDQSVKDAPRVCLKCFSEASGRQ